MFSGIVEEMGVVKDIIRKKNFCVIKVKGNEVVKSTKVGDSISVDGVCLTITDINKGIFSFDVMLETLRKTTLGQYKKGSKVNLERALKMNSRISGHFVSGHVDDVGIVKKVVTGENYTEFQITFKKEFAKYIVPKGSICVDGVSLTVGEVRSNFFSVYLIPFTLEVTNLGLKKNKDKVNLETDILAKYIYKQRSEEATNPYSIAKT